MGIQTQQILIPKKVHIADTAELRCTFTADSPSLHNIIKDGAVKLPLTVFETDVTKNEDYEILGVTLSDAGVNTYQLSITFIPWKTGTIKIPDINIENISLAFKPEEIVSLTKQLNASSLKESTAPLLLPGTIYKVYASIFLGITLLTFGIILIVKRRKVNFFIKNKFLRLRYKINKIKTIRKLKKLAKESESYNNFEKDTAKSIQHILREYLEYRFAYPFTNVVTSNLMKSFTEITQGLLSDTKYEAFEQIVACFIRTDYIRYGSGEKSFFSDDEQKSLIENAIKNIEILETDDEQFEKSEQTGEDDA